LLLAIVQFLQFMVEVFKKQAESTGANNKCFEYVTKCITAVLLCVECIVKFINTQAYIQIALRGKNFCYAAKDGFELAWSNAMRFAVVSGVGTVIMFLGKIFIGVATAGAFYALITFVPSIQDDYLQPFYQVIVQYVLYRSLVSLDSSLPLSSWLFIQSLWTAYSNASLLMRPTKNVKERKLQSMLLQN